MISSLYSRTGAWVGGFLDCDQAYPPPTSPLHCFFSIRAPQEMVTGADTRPNQTNPNNGQTQ